MTTTTAHATHALATDRSDTAAPSGPSHTPRATSLSRFAARTLDVLYQHRMMTTDQIHRLLLPQARYPVYVLKELGGLYADGQVDRVRARNLRGTRGSTPWLWFLTDAGAEQVESAGELPVRPYRVTAEAAAGARQAHTLALNEAGLAFVEHARRLGDECGPLDWLPEVAHRMRDGNRRLADDHVIADAVLDYVHVQGRNRALLRMFLEVDRGTMTTARLAAKLSAYGRMHGYVPQQPDRLRNSAAGGRPAWQYRYAVFPRLVVILDGVGQRALVNRTSDLRARTAGDPRLRLLSRELSFGLTSLDQLRAHGPFAPIFTPLLHDHPPTDIRMQPPRHDTPQRKGES